MLVFLLPLFAIGACVVAARRHARTPAVVSGEPGVPSPIAVLCGFIRAGQEPPPPVILCAIAEAEATHQPEIADSIVRAFIVPTVMQHEAHSISTAKNANVDVGRPLYSKEQIVEMEAHKADKASKPAAKSGQPGGQPGQAQPIGTNESEEDAIARTLQQAWAATRGTSDVKAARVAHTSHVRGEHDAPPEIIGFAPPEQWDEFAARLAREAPDFSGKRHVGQFRARRDRLLEIGVDPYAIVGDPDAQRDALAREMADAFRHAREGGLADHVGELVHIDGAAHEITLSGVLGVIQAAGLEGACAWLERPGDRQRFRNTTAAFRRTNGVF